MGVKRRNCREVKKESNKKRKQESEDSFLDFPCFSALFTLFSLSSRPTDHVLDSLVPNRRPPSHLWRTLLIAALICVSSHLSINNRLGPPVSQNCLPIRITEEDILLDTLSTLSPLCTLLPSPPPPFNRLSPVYRPVDLSSVAF